METIPEELPPESIIEPQDTLVALSTRQEADNPEQGSASGDISPFPDAEPTIDVETYATSLQCAAFYAARGAGLNNLAKADVVKNWDEPVAKVLCVEALGGIVHAFWNESPHSTVAAGIGTTAIAAITILMDNAWQRHKLSKPSHATIPGGYTLECLRTPKIYRTSGSTEVNAHVVGRNYKDAVEPAELTHARLRDAFSVTLRAIEKGAPITQMVVPAGIAIRAGLNAAGQPDRLRRYADILPECTDDGIIPSVPLDSQAVVLDIATVKAELEHMKTARTPATKLIQELAERFYTMAGDLTPNNPHITKTLNGLVARIMAGDSSSSQELTYQWQEHVSHDPTGKPILIRTPVGRQKSRIDSYCLLDSANPYDPLILRYAPDGRPLSQVRLSKITKTPEMRHNHDLLLVQAALAALKNQETKNKPSADSLPADVLPTGSPALRFKLDTVNPNKNRYRLAVLGRAALVTTLTASVVVGGIYATQKLIAKQAVEQQEPTDYFRVDNHGLKLPRPYWPEEIHYKYADGYWHEPTTVTGSPITVPETLSDPTQKHLTVSGMSRQNLLNLPFQEGSSIAALRVKAPSGRTLPHTLFRSKEGIYTLNLNQKDALGTYAVQYDLTQDTSSRVRAAKPLTIKGTKKIRPDDFPLLSGNIRDTASRVRYTYTYDDSETVMQQYGRNHSPRAIVKTANGIQRCQCNTCNSAVAFAEASARPHQKLAHVSGTLHPASDEKHSYLVEGHAWLADKKGTVDATANTTDKHSVIPKYPTTKELDASWKKDSETFKLTDELGEAVVTIPSTPFPVDPLKALAGLGILSVAGIEWRQRPGRRLMQAGRSRAAELVKNGYLVAADNYVPYGPALDYILQCTFGSEDVTPILKQDLSKPHARADIRNIPAGQLEKIRQGDFPHGDLTNKQIKGIRLTAAYLLRAQQHGHN